jgi:hypothetical protein
MHPDNKPINLALADTITNDLMVLVDKYDRLGFRQEIYSALIFAAHFALQQLTPEARERALTSLREPME